MQVRGVALKDEVQFHYELKMRENLFAEHFKASINDSCHRRSKVNEPIN